MNHADCSSRYNLGERLSGARVVVVLFWFKPLVKTLLNQIEIINNGDKKVSIAVKSTPHFVLGS